MNSLIYHQPDALINVSGHIIGGEAHITAIKDFVFNHNDLPILGIAFELANAGASTLEITSHQITLRALNGRELTGEKVSLVKHYKGPIPQGDVLLPGDTRPTAAFIPLVATSLPTNPIWAEALLKVEVRHLSPQSQALYWRSYNIVLQSASYVDETAFQIKGHVADYEAFAAQFRQARRGALNVRVVATLYNATGQFIGGISTYVSGTKGDFEMNFHPPASLGTIAFTKILFAELT